ncbi:16S rRNA (cytosine(1402)-N(4))-methyltransferase RsmH [Rhodobacter calidifons]|uniref:Ribosomal RNA small subunit methyltransferase H n=1 Tax=Rhodobacter calidifons TaxID=2715277 RepID=A0ABX0G7A8_9RHOB|nr:16S rRNA (cytosine(1402)-N(4))-methyltransferase RsmH [Rhodobacter calidifons]NHB77135.1 16S rRNA (cytosine(1402)-N(4))-methyltransferase RsmH [Rhodobacter calidifons]
MSGPLPGQPADPHVPVLIDAILRECAPVAGLWLDGTLGAGGYTRALLAAGAERVIGLDRDPLALRMAADWAAPYGDRVRLVAGRFSELDDLAGEALDGVVLDLGVSSMQLDQAERGFSFMKDGPLDMRMSQSGESAADLVNTADEGVLADILYHYGEERAARRIARAMVAARAVAPITTTARLAEIVAKCLPRPKPGQSHPATRSFQAIRIAVNAEFQELAEGLNAAERALKPGGLLAVVTFHSLEDRIVKRFFQLASGHEANANRYAPARTDSAARFAMVTKKAVAPDAAEVARNPRARSAKLRVGRRTEAPAQRLGPAELGLPDMQKKGRR